MLERSSRQAKLTYAGRRLLEDARLAIATFEQACRNTQLAARGELGSLSIGFMMHAVHTGFPKLMRRFMAQRPEVHVELLKNAPTVAHVVAWRSANENPTLRPFLNAAGVA